MNLRLTLLMALALTVSTICGQQRTPVPLAPGEVENQIRAVAPQVAQRLAVPCPLDRAREEISGSMATGYRPAPSLPSLPPGLKPQEQEALTAMFQKRQKNVEPALLPFFADIYSQGTEVHGQGMAVTLKPLGCRPAEARIENSRLVYHDVYAATDSLQVPGAGESEEFLLLRNSRAPQRFEYEISSATGVKDIALEGNAIHFTNAQGTELQLAAPWLVETGGKQTGQKVRWELTPAKNGRTWPMLALVVSSEKPLHYPAVIDPSWTSTVGSLNTARYELTATLLNDGQVLVPAGVLYNGSYVPAELYNPTTGTWADINPPQNQRFDYTATLLGNGKVMITGGVSINFTPILSATELYNPLTGLWATVGPLHTARHAHTATMLQNGQVLVTGGETDNSGTPTASSELYDPVTATWTVTKTSLNVARYSHTAVLLQNGQVLVVGGIGTSGALNSCELYNPATQTWTLTTGNLNVARSGHTATLLRSGLVLAAGGYNSNYLASAELFDSSSQKWTLTGTLSTARYEHTATMLPSGQVLVAGGSNSPYSGLASTELYNPAKGIWTTTGNLNNARFDHSATLLPSGRVLVAGGFNGGIGGVGMASTELYDPSLGGYTLTGNLDNARDSHTATLLPTGQVLVAGGYGGSPESPTLLNTADLYNPATKTWGLTGSLTYARANHTATLLPSGLVLVAGGGPLAAELYNPSTGFWQTTGSLTVSRSFHTATLLTNGEVLAVGGMFGTSSDTAELYNPASGTWTATGSPNSPRANHTATLLPDQQVLVVGGIYDGASAELYDSGSGTWTATGSLNVGRASQTATLLPNGEVLVAGGVGTNSVVLSSVEVYQPSTGEWSHANSLNTARESATATLLPGGEVLVESGAVDNAPSVTRTSELYNPATGTWTLSGTLNTGRELHTATLLPNGQILIAGGLSSQASGDSILSSSELFDTNLGYTTATRPKLNSVPPISPGVILNLSGSGFVSPFESSGGGTTNDSASNIPVFELQSLSNEQSFILPLAGNHQFNSKHESVIPPAEFPPGYALLTLFVNGTPSTSQIVTYGN